MSLVIGKCNITSFGRAIHNLTRYREEINFNFLHEGLNIRCSNQIESCWASFLFEPGFFTEYSAPADENAFKMSSKSLQFVFKNLGNIERSTDSISIDFKPDIDRVVIVLNKDNDVITKFELFYSDTDDLIPVPTSGRDSNSFNVSSKLFSECIHNFSPSEDEVSLTARDGQVLLSSFRDAVSDCSLTAQTEVVLGEREFNRIQIQSETQIVFNLKDLKAIVTFLVNCSLDFTFAFNRPGDPIRVTFTEPAQYSGSFLLATLADSLMPTSQSTSRTSSKHADDVIDFPDDDDDIMSSIPVHEGNAENGIVSTSAVVTASTKRLGTGNISFPASRQVKSGSQKSQNGDLVDLSSDEDTPQPGRSRISISQHPRNSTSLVGSSNKRPSTFPGPSSKARRKDFDPIPIYTPSQTSSNMSPPSVVQLNNSDGQSQSAMLRCDESDESEPIPVSNQNWVSQRTERSHNTNTASHDVSIEIRSAAGLVSSQGTGCEVGAVTASPSEVGSEGNSPGELFGFGQSPEQELNDQVLVADSDDDS